jgi:hypothetical protein
MKAVAQKLGLVRFRCALLFLLAIIGAGTATEVVGSPSASCDSSTVDDWGPKEARKAREFLSALKSAVQADNTYKLAMMISYPLNVFGADGKRVIHNRSEFVQKYPGIFTTRVRQVVLKQSADCLFGNANGVMVDDGEIWFSEQPTSGFKIITVNLGKR